MTNVRQVFAYTFASAAMILSSCTGNVALGDAVGAEPYDCSDWVVVGRMGEEQIEKGHDSWRSFRSAFITVERRIWGAHIPDRIPITYISHGMIRSDKSFVFVLSQDGEAEREIKTAIMVEAKPLIAKTCSNEINSPSR